MQSQESRPRSDDLNISAVLLRYAALIVAGLAILASLTGLRNGFAMDDVHIIVENSQVHSLGNVFATFTESYWPADKGGALYRPLTSVGFILQWAAGGGSPVPFHIVSVSLYAAVCLLMFRLFEALAELPVAFVAAAMFAVHPLHVEVVANVVGQAELWAALLAVPAVTRFIQARRRGRLWLGDVVTVSGLYGGALLFKEHVVVLPLVLVAAEMLVVRNRLAPGARLKHLMVIFGAMTLVALTFTLARAAVIGDIQGAGQSPIFIGAGYETRFFTMLRVIVEWIRLFFWPSRLSTDYAPLVQMASSFHADMIPSVVVLVAAAGAAFHLRRSRPEATFSLLWVAIMLLIPSNLIVVTGFVLAERALFLASAGVTLLAAIALHAVLEVGKAGHRAGRLATGAVAVLLVLGIIRSSTRSFAWRDNASLIEQNVLDMPTSWYAHMLRAQLHSDRGERADALRETRLAVRLGSETDHRLLAYAGDMFQMHGRCDDAAGYYRKSLALDPNQSQVRVNAAKCAASPSQATALE